MNLQIDPQPHSVTNHFLSTVNENINRMKRDASQDGIVLPGTIEPALYFITETFREISRSYNNQLDSKFDTAYVYIEPKDLIKITSDRHAKFYKHILNQTVSSNHYPSRKKLYPVALSFIDLAGSRHHQSSFLKMPHVHSLFIIPPKSLDRFKLLVADNFRISDVYAKTRDVKTIHCERVEVDATRSDKIISYSSKFYRSNYAKILPEEIRSTIFSMHG